MSLPAFGWLKANLESDEGKIKLEKARKLEALAAELGTSLTHLSLAWCLKNPNVSSVILGASTLEQLKQNLGAAAVVDSLDAETMSAIEKIVLNRPAQAPEY